MRFGLLTLAALCAAGCVTKEPIEREGGGGTTADGAGGSGGVSVHSLHTRHSERRGGGREVLLQLLQLSTRRTATGWPR